MNRTLKLALCAITTAAAFSATAGIKAVDVPRITNGGTGVIEAPAWTAERMAYRADTSANVTSSVPTRAGEASTMVNGQPNALVAVGSGESSHGASTRVMGNAGSDRAHPTWGTPD